MGAFRSRRFRYAIWFKSGSGNFMTRMTAVLATLFFIISLVLGNINSNRNQ
ncbi:preprotein translocase subunit SecG [Salmonella enterica subsp. enterica]|nr:preprotein translocase subunit SecG [Salmonella enterica subsp. enterica]